MSQQTLEHYWQDRMFEEGYFTYPNLYASAVKTFGDGSVFVEVGCWKGRSAAFMAVEIINSKKNIRFDCVDPWEEVQDGQNVGNIYEKFISNTKRVSHVINAIRKTSVEAAADHADESVDFVFIDGHHGYDSVVADINAWLPKMKIGGFLTGHDYGWCSDVRRAVHDTLGEGTGKHTDQYGVRYDSYSDPWNEGCWMVHIQ